MFTLMRMRLVNRLRSQARMQTAAVEGLDVDWVALRQACPVG